MFGVVFFIVAIYTFNVCVKETAAEFNCLLCSLIVDVIDFVTYLLCIYFCVFVCVSCKAVTCHVLRKSCKKLYLLYY